MEVGLIGDVIVGLCELFVRAVVQVFNLVAGPVGYAAGGMVRMYRHLRRVVGLRGA